MTGRARLWRHREHKITSGHGFPAGDAAGIPCIADLMYS